MKLVKRILAITLSLSLISGQSNLVFANDVHEHTDECVVPIPHTHEGTPTTYGGCYKGAEYQHSVCGTATYSSTYDEYVHSGGNQYTSTSTKYYYGLCSGCRQIVGMDTYTYGYGESAPYNPPCGSKITHYKIGYELSCGATNIEYPKVHIHEGDSSRYAGCYKGALLSRIKCTGVITKPVTSDSGTCSTCGQRSWIFGKACPICNYYLLITSGCDGYCRNSDYFEEYDSSVGGYRCGHYDCTYDVSCGFEEGEIYYLDGTEAETYCSKVVMTLNPKK